MTRRIIKYMIWVSPHACKNRWLFVEITPGAAARLAEQLWRGMSALDGSIKCSGSSCFPWSQGSSVS